MSWDKRITIYCEGTRRATTRTGDDGVKFDCSRWETTLESTVELARKKARKDGWVLRDGRDLCNDCAIEDVTYE